MKKAGAKYPAKVAAAVIEKDGKVLIARRRERTEAGGSWEFPGGKVEDGETPEKGLKREIAEELGVSIRLGKLIDSVVYRHHTLSLELMAYHANIVAGEIKLTDHDRIRWVNPTQLDEAEFTEPDRPIVRQIVTKAEKQWKA